LAGGRAALLLIANLDDHPGHGGRGQQRSFMTLTAAVSLMIVAGQPTHENLSVMRTGTMAPAARASHQARARRCCGAGGVRWYTACHNKGIERPRTKDAAPASRTNGPESMLTPSWPRLSPHPARPWDAQERVHMHTTTHPRARDHQWCPQLDEYGIEFPGEELMRGSSVVQRLLSCSKTRVTALLGVASCAASSLQFAGT